MSDPMDVFTPEQQTAMQPHLGSMQRKMRAVFCVQAFLSLACGLFAGSLAVDVWDAHGLIGLIPLAATVGMFFWMLSMFFLRIQTQLRESTFTQIVTIIAKTNRSSTI